MNTYLCCYKNTPDGPTYRYKVKAGSFETAANEVIRRTKKARQFGHPKHEAWVEGVCWDE